MDDASHRPEVDCERQHPSPAAGDVTAAVEFGEPVEIERVDLPVRLHDSHAGYRFVERK